MGVRIYKRLVKVVSNLSRQYALVFPNNDYTYHSCHTFKQDVANNKINLCMTIVHDPVSFKIRWSIFFLFCSSLGLLFSSVGCSHSQIMDTLAIANITWAWPS